MDALVELSDVVRRVVAARVHDSHLIEDLTQEALVHLAAADRQLTGDERRAYAIATARNLVVDHARSSDVHHRHAHRLVDYTSLDGPEHLTLQQEETAALARALERLDAADRDLLLRHEVDGVTTQTLAEQAGTSTGAIAMRLARARAALRLEFVLAFRHVELPTTRCRPILLALSAGDKRMQARLRAGEHLARCSTCADLSPPVALRRRGIAASLIVPIGAALRRAVRSLRDNHVTQAVTMTAVGAAITVIVLVTRADPQPQAAPVRPAAVTTTAPATTTTTTTTVAATATAAPPAACPPPVPLDQTDPVALGCPFAPTVITVTDVPADEGFWAETATGRDVWVQLEGEGESPVDITAGATLAVAGTIEAPPAGDARAADPRTLAAGYELHVGFGDIQTTG